MIKGAIIYLDSKPALRWQQKRVRIAVMSYRNCLKALTLILLVNVTSLPACTRAEFATDDAAAGGSDTGAGGDAGSPGDGGQGGAGDGTGGATDDGGQDSGGSATDGAAVDASVEASDAQQSIDAQFVPPCPVDASTVSDGNGSCAPTFRVLRVGDGTVALSSAATPVFVDERMVDGTLVSTIALPTAAAGTNHPLTISGASTSEGALSLSANGKFLTLAGYAAPPGTPMISSSMSASAPRVVGRIDASGVVDTSTVVLGAFDGNNVRSAVSTDGMGFWVAGSGGSTGGVWFVAFGTVGGIRVLANPPTVRVVDLFAGQLYASSNSGANADVFLVGNGMPAVAGQVATTLPGMPASGIPSPFAFAFFDQSAAVPGIDTLYVADDRAPPIGGVQKWVFDGTIWKLIATFSVLQNPVGFRGLTGFASQVGVTLIASTAETFANRVVVFLDDGVTTPNSTVIATAVPNTIVRGVALSP